MILEVICTEMLNFQKAKSCLLRNVQRGYQHYSNEWKETQNSFRYCFVEVRFFSNKSCQFCKQTQLFMHSFSFKEKLTDSFDAFNVVHNRHRGNRPQKDSLSVEMPLCEWLRKAFKYAIKFPVNIFKFFKRFMILKLLIKRL